MKYKMKVNNKHQRGEFNVLEKTPVRNPKNRKNELWSTYNIETAECYLIQIHVEGDDLKEFNRYDGEILSILYNCRKYGREISIEQKEMETYPDHIMIESNLEKHELKGWVSFSKIMGACK